MLPVVRLGDPCSGHHCWPPRPSVSGSPNVFVNGLPVHRLGDQWAPHSCVEIHTGISISGNPTIFCNGLPVSFVGDAINCGSVMVAGSPNSFGGMGTGGSMANCNCGDGSSQAGTITVGGVTLPVNQNSRENAAKLFEDPYVGTVLAIGDEYETTSQDFSTYPPVQTTPPPEIKEPAKEENVTPPPEIASPPTSCKDFNDKNIDYNFQLSPNVQLRNLTINALFPHSLKAQRGLSIKELVCNLQALAENPLEQLWKKWPGFRFNSGFRTLQNGKSQHEIGQACDIQWPGISSQEYWDRAQWIKDNINFDDFIFEHGNSVWIHLSYNRAGNRRKVRTMYKGGYTDGLKRYYK